MYVLSQRWLRRKKEKRSQEKEAGPSKVEIEQIAEEIRNQKEASFRAELAVRIFTLFLFQTKWLRIYSVRRRTERENTDEKLAVSVCMRWNLSIRVK